MTQSGPGERTGFLETDWTSLMGRDATKTPPLGLLLDPASRVALHRQIGEQLRSAILERRLAPGAHLPSSRLLARELGCARGTVLLALDQMVAEGYVVSTPGSGVSVASDLPDDLLTPPTVRTGQHQVVAPPPRLSQRAEAQLAICSRPGSGSGGAPPTAFALGRPAPDAFPFPLWAKLLEAEWHRPAQDIAASPHPFGHAGLRRAIAAYLGAARGFACAAAEVVVTSGVRQSVALLGRLLLDPGETAWVEEPGFPGTREALRAAGARPVPVPVDAFGFSPEAAQALAPEARLAVVAPAHHYPLGAVLSLQRRLALLAWAERAGGWIIEDDYDGEYRYAGRPLAPLRALDRAGRVAYVGSFSKLLFPSLRLSYLALPSALVDAAERLLVASGPAGASLLGQGALARFIDDGHFAAHLRRTRRLYAERQEVLVAAARRHLAGLLDMPPDPGGMHLVARPRPACAEGFDDRSVAEAAARVGVSVAPLSACCLAEPATQGLLLGYAAVSPKDIEVAVIRLRSALTG